MGRINQFAQNFDGECLSFSSDGSLSHVSIVKGQQALKFKCMHGHAFYKYVDELKQFYQHHSHLFGLQRKCSNSTMASSSDEEEDVNRIWCPKCVSFFRSCQSTAKQYNFSLIGKLYSSKLYFCCPRKKHNTKISYSRRVNSNVPLTCMTCQKQDREAFKAQQRLEEQ
jgi:hypothetical protein